MNSETLQELVNKGLSVRQIGEKLNVSYTTVRYWLKKFNLKTTFNSHIWDINKIKELSIISFSISDLLKNLNRGCNSGNYVTLKRIAKENNFILPYNKANINRKKKVFLGENSIFVLNSTVSRSCVRKRLLSEGKGTNCEICGQENIWFGQKLTMRLDHINGVPNDNRKENLRFICPNCDSTLETYCGKNTKKNR